MLQPNDIHAFTAASPISILYFKGDDCTVCHFLGPKVKQLEEELQVPLLEVDMPGNLHLAATEMVLSVPVVKLYVEGREVWKEGAYLQPAALQQQVE
ncbi:MAG: thioredoxin family protein, partial [Bacteroidia bacterium]